MALMAVKGLNCFASVIMKLKNSNQNKKKSYLYSTSKTIYLVAFLSSWVGNRNLSTDVC